MVKKGDFLSSLVDSVFFFFFFFFLSTLIPSEYPLKGRPLRKIHTACFTGVGVKFGFVH